MLLTAREAARHADQARRLMSGGTSVVTERTVRSWVARGHLAPVGLDASGRQLFALADVARAERGTRERALRGTGAQRTPTDGHRRRAAGPRATRSGPPENDP
ncbi:MerR family transcriptional regulator [Streptomyces shenzhenensis]